MKNRLDTGGLRRDEPERIVEEEEEEKIEPVPTAAMTGVEKYQKRSMETERI